MSLRFVPPEDARPTRRLTAIVMALAVLVPLSAWLWPLGLSAFASLAGLLALALRLGRDKRWLGGPVFVLAALTVLAMMSVVVSPAYAPGGPLADISDSTTQTWLKLPLELGLYASLVLGAVALSEAGAQRAGRWMVWGVLGLAVIVAVEGLSRGGVYIALREAIGDPIRPDLGARNSALATYTLALLIWPVGRALLDDGWPQLALMLAAALLLGALMLGAWAPVVAFAAGLIAYGVARLWPRKGSLVIGGLLALKVLALPWAVLAAEPMLRSLQPHIGASWSARVDIWTYTAHRVAEQPLLGWGLDASRTFGAAVPLHPHSGPLQLWLELGAAGAVIAAVFWLILLRKTRRPETCAAAVAYFTIGALSFGVWQEWWLALGAFAAVWCVVLARRPDSDPYVLDRLEELQPLAAE